MLTDLKILLTYLLCVEEPSYSSMEDSGNAGQEDGILEKLPKKRLRKMLIVEDEEKSDDEGLEIQMTRVKLLAGFGTEGVMRNNTLKVVAKATVCGM